MNGPVELRIGRGNLDRQAQLKLLRAVASFEVIKGLIVLLAGCAILLLVHRDAGDIADDFLQLLHISPDHHFAQVFLNWADTLTDTKLWAVAAAALVYAALRFVEAYGLWKARAWAEWIALISGALYLPFEAYKIIQHATPLHVSILIVNLAVVLFMVQLRLSARKARRAQHPG